MDGKKWSIGLAEKGHNYTVTAIWMEETESWNAILKIDGRYIRALATMDPSMVALEMIAQGQQHHLERLNSTPHEEHSACAN